MVGLQYVLQDAAVVYGTFDFRQGSGNDFHAAARPSGTMEESRPENSQDEYSPQHETDDKLGLPSCVPTVDLLDMIYGGRLDGVAASTFKQRAHVTL